ncbi:alpha/beta hydrolase [Vitreoscilla stercoraria]|uniref:Lysophospholipase n=1 Tax=Vitreoscilla stercoraria TaxID=61 RepID=A0ABY4EAM0_VITST|nr:alpha/beta fold hydrolase [Vitreoscilla stercoraria]UOO91593.1 lysophospholipase [Vitreoscilla stercoraria]
MEIEYSNVVNPHSESPSEQNWPLTVKDGYVECKRHVPNVVRAAPPILFLHGIFVGAWCWQHFLKDFAEHGYDAWAISFRGHGHSSRDGEFGLNDFVLDAQAAVDEIKRVTGQMPLVVGHSMGGLVLQRLMLTRQLAGAVLMCAMPPQGLLPLAVGNWCLRPLQMLELGQLMLTQQAINAEQLQFGMFAQPIEAERLQDYAKQTVVEAPRLWSDLMQGAMYTPWLKNCPMALVAASNDTLVPPAITQMTAMSYSVSIHWLDGFGHGVMLERDWQKAAACVRGVIHKMHA